MAIQLALTIIAQVKPDETQHLRDLIKTMRLDIAGNDLIPFGKLSHLHFARLLVLDEAHDLKDMPIRASLVFMCDIDGSQDAFLSQFVDVAGSGLDKIYSHCDDYPLTLSATREKRLDYIRSRTVKADAMYVNTTGRTVQQVHQEAQLREAIQGFLDTQAHNWAGRSPLNVRSAIQQFVNGQERLSWARKPAARPSLLWRLKEGLHLIGVPLILLILLPIIILAFPVWLALLRYHELTDPAPDVRAAPDQVRALTEIEDHVAQNQFGAIGYAKPGAFRRFTATAVLWLVNYGARHLLNKGDLAGVKTIHFARWVFINEKRRLVFASSYDGSLESYMDDFIDKVAWGLNAAFSNGVGYPKTNWLVADGATNEQAFKHYIRTHQLPTECWYSAYDNLTALNIKQNEQIRAGLYGPMSTRAAEEWLRQL